MLPYGYIGKERVNSSKSEYMIAGTPQRLRSFESMNLILDNNEIKRVDSSKYLGMHLDSHISWNTHVDKLAKKVSSRIGVLKVCSHCLTLKQ